MKSKLESSDWEKLLNAVYPVGNPERSSNSSETSVETEDAAEPEESWSTIAIFSGFLEGQRKRLALWLTISVASLVFGFLGSSVYSNLQESSTAVQQELA
jgi:hypothetical protein